MACRAVTPGLAQVVTEVVTLWRRAELRRRGTRNRVFYPLAPLPDPLKIPVSRLRLHVVQVG